MTGSAVLAAVLVVQQLVLTHAPAIPRAQSFPATPLGGTIFKRLFYWLGMIARSNLLKNAPYGKRKPSFFFRAVLPSCSTTTPVKNLINLGKGSGCLNTTFQSGTSINWQLWKQKMHDFAMQGGGLFCQMDGKMS